MTMWLRQSTAVNVQFGPFLDSTDGVVLETGLATAMDNATTGIRLSKNGAAFADRGSATAPSYDAMGCYRINLSTADTNTLGTFRMIFEQSATCLPVWQDFMVVTANIWDTFFGTDALNVEPTAIQNRQEMDSNSTRLTTLAGGIIEGATTGTPSNTSTDTNLTGLLDNELVNRVIVFTGGTANGQAAKILTYTATNGVVTFAALTTAPAASDNFKII